MSKPESDEPIFAVCINNRNYPASLELHKIYRVIPDKVASEDGYIRVIDESGEDYHYPSTSFMVLDLPDALRGALMQAG